VGHLLKETNSFERERLVLEVIPKKYLPNAEDIFYPTERIEKCFRDVFATLDDERKTKVARRFVTILKEESGEQVLTYQTAFFRAPDLNFLATTEVALIKEHLLSRMRDAINVKLCATSRGLVKFLEKGEYLNYFHSLLGGMVNRQRGMREAARALLTEEFWRCPDDIKKDIKEKVQEWEHFYEEKGSEENATLFNDLRADLDDDIPF